MSEERRADLGSRNRIDELEGITAAKLEEVQAGYVKRANENRDRIRHNHRQAMVILAVLFVVQFGLGSWALILTSRTEDLVHQIQDQRRQGAGINCGISSAIIEAGRATITNGGTLPPKLERFLERHGFPPAPVRERQAAMTARRYAQSISTAVARSVGPGSGVIRPNGSIDCARLRAIVVR
jgi:hypothetical protein